MRKVLACALMVSGCAAAMPRFSVGQPKAGAPHELERAVLQRANEGAPALAACFDELADRRDLRGPLDVELQVAARGATAALYDVAPLSAATAVDAQLGACLHEVVDAWRVPASDGRVAVPLRVVPVRRADPERRIATVKAFRAEE